MRITFSVIIFVLTIFIFSNASNAKAAAGDNISGYAWSENIGWISFNCTNNGTCATSNYGVNLDMTTKNLSGFAWSDNIGWISFNAADVAGCPAGACQPRYDSATGEFLGWARVLSWGGWISLNCANGGCGASNYKVSLTGNDFVGWAWEDDVIGWISFSSKNCDINGDGQSEGGAGCPPASTLIPNYKVYFSGTCLIDGTACAADTNQCTDDICGGGICTHPNKTNDTICDDSKSCTDNDVCSGGGLRWNSRSLRQ